MSDGQTPEPRYREVTLTAILFALVVGAIMNAAITYSGLKIGFTIVGSSIAAVLGFGVLRGLLRKGTILEVNIAQTVASSVNTTNSGIIFTVPVLLLLGYSISMGGSNFWLLVAACMAGALMGVAFIIPLRKQMIDIERLRFPSGTAVGTILKSPGAGPAKAIVLVLGILLGALLYLPAGIEAIKTEAQLKDLDGLVRYEHITPAERRLTLEIEGWIQAQSAPEGLVAKANLVREREDAKFALSQNPSSEELYRTVQELTDRVEEADIDPRYPTSLLVAIAEAEDGEREWDSLRSGTLGWAEKPVFPTYAELDLRVPFDESDRLPPEEDLDGDGQPDGAIPGSGTRNGDGPDRNGDGHPDLLVTAHSIDVGRLIGLPGEFLLVFAIAPFALGAGYLSGRAGLMVLAGGVLAYLILNPILYAQGHISNALDPWTVPAFAQGAINRPLGIGLLLGGALMGVLVTLPAIGAAPRSVAAAGRTVGGGEELGLKTLGIAVIFAFVVLFLTTSLASNRPINEQDPVSGLAVSSEVEPVEYNSYQVAFASEAAKSTWLTDWTEDDRAESVAHLHPKPGLLSGLDPILRALIVAFIGALWMWFSGIIIAQCTGMTDWSPISGIALLTVVLVMLLTGTGNVVGAVLVGATLCVAITLAADMMSDLRSGYIVGALPKRQQAMELGFAWIGPFICMLTILLIAAANMQQFGIPMGVGTETEAPQAEALRAVINGVQGGDMPYVLYGLGALLGLLLGLGSFAGLGVLVGLSMYLPFIYISTYGIGCITNIVVARVKGKRFAEDWGVPLAAGLIVGEALLSLGINAVVLLRG